MTKTTKRYEVMEMFYDAIFDDIVTRLKQIENTDAEDLYRELSR